MNMARDLRHSGWIVALSLILHANICHSSHIQVDSDGGYKKIVVAIPNRQPESPKLVEDLKEFLTAASKTFHKATRNHAFFSEIQILLPSTWTNDTYPEATSENHVEADVRVDSFNPLPTKGDVYTYQPRGCGERGDYIYLNSNLFQNWKTSKSQVTVTKFVQEWSKLRYGVFDEYGYDNNDLYPKTYTTPNKTSEVTGCKLSDSTFTSIMDKSDLNGGSFCDISKDQQHNKYAPTPQNNMCKLKNTWDVVKNSPDLKNVAPIKNKPITPTFTIVKASPIQVAVVIDPNLCERFGNKGSHMLELTFRQFESDFPTNGKIVFVIADGRPEDPDLTTLKKLKDLGKTVGKANLADGIQKGINMISSSKNGHLILISDGPKLNPKDFKSVGNNIENLKFSLLTWTPVSSVLKYDANDMKEFVNNPSKYLWMDIQVDTLILNCDTRARIQIEDTVALLLARLGDDDFYPKKIKVYEDVTLISGNLNKFVNPVPGTELIFNMYFCSVDADDKRLTLKINDNEVSDVSKHDMVSNLMATYTMSSTPPEIKYEWNIVHPQTYVPTSSVWLKIDNYIQPEVILTGQIGKDSKTDTNIPWKFFAFSPNENTVNLEVSTVNNETSVDDMRDNGNGDPDVMANDKIYSRYFFNANKNKERGSFRLISKNKNGDISSFTSIGTFYFPSLDVTKMPPNRIADFRINKSNKGEVTLKWTAPGDNYDQGTALAYYTRNTTVFNDIVNIKFDKQAFTKLTNNPQPAGREESITLNQLTSGEIYYHVITAVDANGNVGEMSNIVTVYASPNAAENEEDKSGKDNKSEFPIILVIGISVGILALILIILGGVCFYVRIKRNRNNPKPSQIQISHSAQKGGADIIRNPSANTRTRTTNKDSSRTGIPRAKISTHEHYHQELPPSSSPPPAGSSFFPGGYSSDSSSNRRPKPNLYEPSVCISHSTIV